MEVPGGKVESGRQHSNESFVLQNSMSLYLAEEQKMKKVLIMLLVIGLASSGVGLGTAFSTPMGFNVVNIGDGTVRVSV